MLLKMGCTRSYFQDVTFKTQLTVTKQASGAPKRRVSLLVSKAMLSLVGIALNFLVSELGLRLPCPTTC